MRCWTMRLFMACALIAVGWAAGRAQAPTPDFELRIEIPGGYAPLTCTRRCELKGAKDAPVVSKPPKPEYTFGCSGRSQERCTAVVHGFAR